MARVKTGVLISGSGTNLQALLDACATPDYPAEITVVIANKNDAYGLERARAAGVPTHVLDHKTFNDRASFDAGLDRLLREADCEIVCLAGFMRILSDGFVENWAERMINIHPSLLPSFRGLDAQGQALRAGVRIAGASVHFVVPEMDAGPIIVQGAVPVFPDDDTAALTRRILTVEHRIYPLALRLLASGHVRMAGGRAVLDGPAEDTSSPLIYPPDAV